MGVEKGKDNNFNIIRLVAALMVMSGHMAYIMGGGKIDQLLWDKKYIL